MTTICRGCEWVEHDGFEVCEVGQYKLAFDELARAYLCSSEVASCLMDRMKRERM